MPKPNPGETKSDFVARCLSEGYSEGLAVECWDLFEELTGRARTELPDSAFVFPGERRYPIHDRAHAANALARASGKSEWEKVRAAV